MSPHEAMSLIRAKSAAINLHILVDQNGWDYQKTLRILTETLQLTPRELMHALECYDELREPVLESEEV